MASKRNVEDRILDAARACVEAFGVRRTTLTDVARRAGVSRPTVYRRWPDATALVADLLTRELRRILSDEGVASAADPAGESVRPRLVRHAAGVARAMLAHPLFTRIVDTEPELLATYTFHRLGTSHRAALDLVEPVVAEGQRDGSVRAGDPEALARLVLVTVQGTVTSRRLFADVLDEDGLVRELAVLLDGYLAP
ncbi:helix-turn-helix domain-containing protein [Nocardiopsis sp. CT-R113]|uniref:Helix-turn-helix domain-containing protein n=1 Tax=Nocardiopsis codii TaxID=3065942 RepID=A0ABU7K803_9ACTN|nr:helix-turn-helix domain-containing protein [Nocardiopsis sp. CT-R113]MEE2038370.1 helix-turn-helix domain-containing protein [Nocardiopsis sp. CT-R113]